MSYAELIGHLAIPLSSSAESLTSAAVVKRHAVMEGLKCRRFMFAVTTATVSSGAIIVKLKKYPTVGSSSGAVELASLSIPSGVAAGSVYYKDVDSVKLDPGSELIVEVTTAAAGGGAAGAGFSGISAFHNPEDPQNISSMVESA